ncbi:uncharacterized protein LOC128884850 [Hylaeus volcanicus]|uniref:uncharacterized protein LOC128884850 n=1 Tax=Hylaeus volcanicus TaxID=313075 RepID=UPI0023B7A26B|nr:uncharacterized protein LOC128884850 [Hylaeus volcanicus]
MKFLVVLGALAIQCAATKPWSNVSYPEETFSLFGWIGYLKRLSLILLMLSGVILYYVPESRPHARRICYTLIDFTANSLKLALSARENDYLYDKIKSKYHRARYEQSLLAQKRRFEDLERVRSGHGKKAKASIDNDELPGVRERRKLSGKQSKDCRQSRHRLRSSAIKTSPEPCMEDDKLMYFYSDKLEELQKYVKTSMCDTKRASGTAIENYALLISGSPRQMAMLDEKYEKDDVVIVEDPYLRVEYKECGTSTDKLSSKGEVSGSELEGPTRDHNDNVTDSGMETYVKDVDLTSAPEVNTRYSDYTSLYQTSQYQCGGECCGLNGCSMSSGELNSYKEDLNLMSPIDIKNVLKSSRSMVTPKTRTRIDENSESLFTINYNDYGCKTRLLKSNNVSNERKVNFLNEEKQAPRKREMTARQHENTTRINRRKKSRNSNLSPGYCCSDSYYYTDRGGEADDENSLHRGRVTTANPDLDERPQRENYVIDTNSDDSIFDYNCEDFPRPILKNQLKPALLRAVNWIFGGCPEASRRAAMKRSKVGKEEIEGFSDEWLL